MLPVLTLRSILLAFTMSEFPAEKTVLDDSTESLRDSPGYETNSDLPDLTWTEEEENALVRKFAPRPNRVIDQALTILHRTDFIVMSLLILGFFALQLDRGNMWVNPRWEFKSDPKRLIRQIY